MHFKSILLAAVGATTVLAGATTLASAADLILPAPTPAYGNLDVAIATDTWTGFYVGAHLGGATTHEFKESTSAWAGGAQIGYLQQLGQFVLGAELQGTLSDDLHYELTPGAGINQGWSVAAKARAGVALDQTLIYGTAGLALAELKGAGATVKDAETHGGFVFGAGVEQGLGGGWSLRAEYQQTRFWEVGSSVAGAARNDDLTNHSILAGVNYRF